MKVISVVSGKGGVGKSTTVANLGIALAQFGKDVTIVDANFSTPDLTMHFNIPMGTPTLHHVMGGEYELEDALHIHPSGMKIIPGSLSVYDIKKARYTRLERYVEKLSKKGDFVILDTQAGLGPEVTAAIAASDEVLVVTNPDWPSITNALKTILISREHGAKIMGVVMNKVRKDKIEPNLHNVESILEAKVVAVVPEDAAVRDAISRKNPVVASHPDSDAAIAFKQLAAHIAGVEYKPPGKWRRRINVLLKRLIG